VEHYDVDFGREGDDLQAKIGALLADATRFDLNYRRNAGISVMPVVARWLLSIKGDYRHPELTADLKQMIAVDAAVVQAALSKSLA